MEIHGERVPLESDPSAALAYAIEDSDLWKTELAGLLAADTKVYPATADGPFLLSPHRAGRVPVVLVHGTASSPVRWAEVLNDLLGNPQLRDRVQPWIFVYTTGNPILYSASKLRTALRNTVAELDPRGCDPALGSIVLIGHSQGGLLVRLMATESEDD